MTFGIHQQLAELEHNPHRLGRHIRHDPRSLEYPVGVIPLSALQSKRWIRRIPILDQGDLGSCTANAATGWLGTDNSLRQGLTKAFDAALDEAYAVDFYSQETRIDSIAGTYPPTDSGSNGLAIGKVLKLRKLASSYRHAFGLRATLTGMQHSPILIGIPWFANMFKPAPSGRISIGGRLAGGHEVLLDEIDVANKRVWFANSWGTWGVDGRAWFAWDDLDYLLQQNGDALLPVPA